MIRRLLATATVLAALALSGFAVSAPATAAPYPPTPTAPSLSASAYDPCAGAANVLLGKGFQPGETVTLVLGGTGELGRPVAAADGTFRITVTIPLSARGTGSVVATGLTSGATASVRLAFPCVLGQNTTEIGGGGNLAYTGFAVGGALVAAAVLLGAGGAVLMGSRRRRSSSALG